MRRPNITEYRNDIYIYRLFPFFIGIWIYGFTQKELFVAVFTVILAFLFIGYNFYLIIFKDRKMFNATWKDVFWKNKYLSKKEV